MTQTNKFNLPKGAKFVDLLTVDINGLFRGKRIDADKFASVCKKGIYLPYSVYALNINGHTVESTRYGLKSGDKDAICRPIVDSLNPVNWTNPPGGQILLQMFDEEDQPFSGDPRMQLQSILARFESHQLCPVMALEYEFYLIDKQLTKMGAPQPPLNPNRKVREKETQVYSIQDLDDYHSFLTEVNLYAEQQNIDCQAIVSEYAPGQFEINLPHGKDILWLCDEMLYLKRIIKAIARKHNFEASFMAKPYAAYSGSGAHIHINLNDAEGNNVFAQKSPTKPERGEKKFVPNETLAHAIAGICTTMDDFMLLFAPQINSYRRFTGDSFVPLQSDWAANDRTTAVRIPISSTENCRIEHRVGGADTNPYLLASAVLAGVLAGIEHKLTPEAPREHASTNHAPTLPIDLHQAIDIFKNSDWVKSYFDEALIELIVKIKSEELSLFNQHISPVEYTWYLHNV